MNENIEKTAKKPENKIQAPAKVDNYVWLVNESTYVEVWWRIGAVWSSKKFKSDPKSDARTKAHRFTNVFDPAGKTIPAGIIKAEDVENVAGM